MPNLNTDKYISKATAKKPKKPQKPKHSNTLLIVILLMFLTLCVSGGALAALVFLMPSFKVDSYFKYVERGVADEYALVFENEAVPDKYYALSFEGDTLLDMNFLIDYGIDPYIFWDEDEQILTISTPLKIIRMTPGASFYTVNGKQTPYPGANTALYAENGKVFIPLSFAAQFYQIESTVSEETKIVIVDSLLTERSRTVIKSGGTPIRHAPDIKSDIAEKLKKGSYVYIFGKNDEAGFYRVRTENGAFGWLRQKEVANIEKLAAQPLAEETAPLPQKYSGRKLSLVWDQISGGGESDWVYGKIAAVNVVSPTWLSLGASLNVADDGSTQYADASKASGYALWPLFSNSFNAERTHSALSSTARRQKIIEELLGVLDKYNAEGLNVDFESYKIEDGYYYTQFLRELCVALRLNGYISSVDLPPPTLSNSPTDRAQIGKYADYIIVMAYDQHWSNAPTKGPVAAYDWVLAGIENTISYVPAEKVVLGLPLYTRIWYEPKQTGGLSSRDFAMQRAYDLFMLREAETQWEENTKYLRGQYEYEIDGETNVITAWLETNESLRYKAELVNELELAGAACWKKGLETEGFWEMLAEVIK